MRQCATSSASTAHIAQRPCPDLPDRPDSGVKPSSGGSSEERIESASRLAAPGPGLGVDPPPKPVSGACGKLAAKKPTEDPRPGPVQRPLAGMLNLGHVLYGWEPTSTLKASPRCQGGRPQKYYRGADPQFRKAARLFGVGGSPLIAAVVGGSGGQELTG